MSTNKEKMDTNEYPLKQECYDVIGCAMAVHNELGNGFLEPVYQEALAIQMTDENIPFEKEKQLTVIYKDHILTRKYYADFLCFGELILELKVCDGIIDEHLGQVINYLKATNLQVGLLLNFGTTKLQYKRVIV